MLTGVRVEQDWSVWLGGMRIEKNNKEGKTFVGKEERLNINFGELLLYRTDPNTQQSRMLG